MRIIATFSELSRQRCFPPPVWSRLEKIVQAHAADFHWLPWSRPEPTGEKSFAAVSKKLGGGGGADILITCWGMPNITPEVLDANPNLKLIAHAAGSVSQVDIEAWKRGNIKVTNVMHQMSFAVAEFALCLMLNGLRRFATHYKPELVNSSPFYNSDHHGGFALRHKRVGLIGFGIIARQTLKLLQPFGCDIVVADPFVPADAIAQHGAKKIELDELCQTSHILSLHAPGTEATKNLLDERRLRLLQPGAIIVNTARGIIIDHDALAKVAAEGKIAAFLDVTYPEPLPPDHPLRKLSNITLTGHVAGPTHDEWPLLGTDCLNEVERFLKNQPLQNLVTETQYQNQSRTT